MPGVRGDDPEVHPVGISLVVTDDHEPVGEIDLGHLSCLCVSFDEMGDGRW